MTTPDTKTIRAHLSDGAYPIGWGHATILTLCDEVERLRTENERLRAALAPFSEESAYWFSHNYNREDRPVEGFEGYTPVMTCGDLFNARVALAQKGASE